jgi:uncharacterized protein (TIGR02453 family)
MAIITNATFDFLKLVGENNNRDWFQANKHLYEASHLELQNFAAKINELMSQHDQIVERSPKKSIFRIYRDVRFSKDKSPYKTHWAGSVKRDTAWLRGGYYYHIGPGQSYVAAGFWNPESSDLKLIRSQIAADPDSIQKINIEPKFVKLFGGIYGEKLKNAPRGFDPENPAVEWLKHKQLIVSRKFSDKEVLQKNFPELVNESFKGVRPFFNYMSDILTTNLNGEPLY